MGGNEKSIILWEIKLQKDRDQKYAELPAPGSKTLKEIKQKFDLDRDQDLQKLAENMRTTLGQVYNLRPSGFQYDDDIDNQLPAAELELDYVYGFKTALKHGEFFTTDIAHLLPARDP